MQTLVYFSNDGIQVLQGIIKGGHLNISNFKLLTVAEGSLFNGVIMNEAAIKQTIAEALKESPHLFKNMKLIIDSSMIVTKNVEVPKLKPKEMAAAAAMAFEDAAGHDELVVDYAHIPGLTSNRLLCCGVEKRLLESYISIFVSLKIQIKSIDVGLNALIQYLSATRDYKGMTVVINILDGQNRVSLFWENGIYSGSDRSQLTAERGTAAFADELLEELSALLQLYKSQASEDRLKMSLYAGLDEFELSRLTALNFDPELHLFLMPQTPNIKNGFVMDESFDFGRFIYPIAGFFTGIKPINYLAAFKKSNMAKKDRPFGYKLLIVPIAMILICLITFGVFFGLKYNAQKKLEELNAYIGDANNQAEYLQAKASTEELNRIDMEISNIETITMAINSNPDLVSETMNTIISQGSGAIVFNRLEYDGTIGVIHITATASNEKEAASYIERLKSTQYFALVNYTGYSQVKIAQPATATPSTTTTSTTTTVIGYGFTADAYLKAGEAP